MMIWVLAYLALSTPFAARVAVLSGWPYGDLSAACNVASALALLLFGPLLWIEWARAGRP